MAEHGAVDTHDVNLIGSRSMRERKPNADTFLDKSSQQATVRPTVDDLRRGRGWRGITELFAQPTAQSTEEAKDQAEKDQQIDAAEKRAESAENANKFGMWDGVFARCLLNIFGVIMFLRVGWMVGYAGIWMSWIIILVSVLITTITTLSLSAICTNGTVAGGGAYYLISRSLGPAFGAAIGTTFFAANAIAVALYLIGFAETVVGMVDGPMFGSGLESWDLRIIAVMALIVLLILCFVGVGWVIKVQLGLLVVLVISIAAFIIGCFMSPQSTDDHAAFVGFELGRNWNPQWTPKDAASAAVAQSEDGTVGFALVFAVFFPAVTGIMAGANISGDLKNPSYAIPKGTLMAVGWSTIVYLLLAFLIGSVCVAEVQLADGKWVGLIHDSLLMAKVAVWPPLVYAGIFAATLSSALASLVGAPRILQALAKDNLFPVLAPFAKGYGAGNEPIRGYALTFVIAFLCILPGSLNQIAPLISNFFMLSYAMSNGACFAAEMSRSPGWRPTFRYYNKWLSLVGAITCVGIMLFFSLAAGFATIVISIALYAYVAVYAPYQPWGAASRGWQYVRALDGVLTLSVRDVHIKNWRPQYLVLVDDLPGKPHFAKLARTLRKGHGLVMFGQVMEGDLMDSSTMRAQRKKEVNEFLFEHKLKHSFANVVVAPTLREGARAMLQCAGLGVMSPNTLMMGFKTKWMEAEEEDVANYVGLIGDAFDCGNGVVVIRDEGHNLPGFSDPVPLRGMQKMSSIVRGGRRNSDQRDIEEELSRLDTAAATATIDVWWLSDDGGLTVLVPHILRRSRRYRHCKLRVFAAAQGAPSSADGRNMLLAREVQRMEELMARFRIDCEVLDATAEVDADEVTKEMTALEEAGVEIDEALRPATIDYLRTGIQIGMHSTHASFVVVTMPVPRTDVDPKMYMTWLRCLSQYAPRPYLLVRGNQESVLTFSS